MARLATITGILFAAAAAGCITPDGYYRPDGGQKATGGAAGQAGSSGAIGSGGAATGSGGAGTGTGGAATGTGGSTIGSGGSAAGGKAGALAGATGQGGALVGTGGTVATTGTAGSGCVPTLILPYSDDFESDTVGMQATHWLFDTYDSDTTKGTFTVVSDGGSKVLQGAANSSDFIMDIGGDLCWTDYTFQVDTKLISGSSYEFGVFGRFALGGDKGNYYQAYMDDTGAVQLRVRLNGSSTTLGTKSKSTTGNPVVGTVYTFVLDMHGTTISVSVNGTPRVSMVMDTTLSAGGIGLIVSNGTVEFDNVQVTQ